MASERRSRSGRRRGGTMVEFALVFLLFLVLVLGLLDLGRALWVFNGLNHAAKEAARYAMVHGSLNPIDNNDPSVEAFAKQQVIGVERSTLQASVSYSPDNSPGSQVTVTVAHDLKFVAGSLIGVSDMRMVGRSTKTIIN